MIPNIIHSTGPTDKNRWHPVWTHCEKSWKKEFSPSHYSHILWNDEDLDILVKEEYPQYWDFYQSFPFHIMKIDFSRLCMMHKYGGIYHDLDMYCYKDFYNDIKNYSFLLLESCMPDEFIQNCMMASEPGNEYWMYLMEEIKRSYYNYPGSADLDKNKPLDQSFYIKDTISCYAMTRATLRYDKPVAILKKEEYNPPCNTYSKEHRTKHMLTNTWGKEYIDANIENMKTWNGYYDNLKDYFRDNYINRSDLDKDALGEIA